MDGLAAHLENQYGVSVELLAELDRDVWRAHLSDGPDWVARVFGPQRQRAVVDQEAELLRRLAEAGFPAERLAAAEPVTTFADGSVLVTGFVRGDRPGGARAWAILGALLGGLHSRAAEWALPGGSWHHLADGAPAAEIAAAVELLEGAQAEARVGQLAAYGTLLDALERLDPCADLPHALVHPDCVPVNAIDDVDANPGQPGRGLVIVDWTGAGRGPRLWSLAFLLWAAGARDLRFVDAVVSRYRRRITLVPEELDRLEAVIAARPLLIDCWRIAHQNHPAATVAAGLPELHRLSQLIADRARRAFAD